MRKWVYFEEYRNCGCVSDEVESKDELQGYCSKHGNEAQRVHKVHATVAKKG